MKRVKAKKCPTRTHQVGKGLVRKVAIRRARKRDGGDYRGATYDKSTGKATLT